MEIINLSTYLFTGRFFLNIYSLIPLFIYVVTLSKNNQLRTTNLSKQIFFIELTKLVLGICVFKLSNGVTIGIWTVIFDTIITGLWYWIMKMNMNLLNNNK